MRASTGRPPLAVAAIVVGGALVVVGLVGLAVDRKDVSAPVAATTTTTTTSSATTTTTTVAAETPAAFLDLLAAAFRSADLEFLVARLNSAVIDRFGEAACRTTLAKPPPDPTAAFTVQGVGPPTPYAWTTDNRTTTVPNTVAVTASRVSGGVTSLITAHLSAVNGKFTWFSDCGVPK